jgi:glutamate decarboxylase
MLTNVKKVFEGESGESSPNGHDTVRDVRDTTREVMPPSPSGVYRGYNGEIPKYKLAEDGLPPKAVYEIIRHEQMFDCQPDLNLSSFCTTFMEPEARQLIMDSLHVNFIDHDQYPQTEVIHRRCVAILADLLNAPKGGETYGTGTIGSSEAVMLAGLAHKWAWRNRRKAEGKPHDRPNIIYGGDVQIVWKKFARYFDVEERVAPMTKDTFVLTAEQVEELIDENTTCVCAINGTTFTGEQDEAHKINDLLLRVKREKGWDIALHIDGASGSFITQFTQPDTSPDFRLEQVKSINVSGHKTGLVYPGVGWVIFRDKSCFPEDLIFYVNYLGSEMPTATLNFSRGSSHILAQYYMFLRLGRQGFDRLAKMQMENAAYLSQKLVDSGRWEILGQPSIPVVGVKLKPNITRYNVFDVSFKLRERGWVVSAYTLPPDAEEIAMLRVVVRAHMNKDMCDILAEDIEKACRYLDEHGGTAKAPALHKKEKAQQHC